MIISDRESFDQEQAIIAADDMGAEYSETVLGEGSVYEVVVPTGYDLSGPEMVKTGDYLLIRAVELEEPEKDSD